jgi:hypothetical protein
LDLGGTCAAEVGAENTRGVGSAEGGASFWGVGVNRMRSVEAGDGKQDFKEVKPYIAYPLPKCEKKK